MLICMMTSQERQVRSHCLPVSPHYPFFLFKPWGCSYQESFEEHFRKCCLKLLGYLGFNRESGDSSLQGQSEGLLIVGVPVPAVTERWVF